MKNPTIKGAVIVETKGAKAGTECYYGPAKYAKPMKVFGGVFKNGFNPKKVVFFGETTIYTKNHTIKIDHDGNASFLPVEPFVDENGVVEQKVAEKYGLEQ